MDQNGHPRIGVYICHCGLNIAGTVNVAEVREFISHAPNVTIARDYKFMCSDPGQALIQDDIRKLGVNRVVVAACSPLMHEITFRNAAKKAGLNRYLVQIANIREHCSWIHDDIPKATEKAKALVAGAVRRVALHQPLEPMRAEINPNVLVVGGGITGIQAALEIAEAGHRGLPGRARANHRRAHGTVRQDVSHARLRGLHPDTQDGLGRPPREHQAAELQRSGGVFGIHRKLQGEGAEEVAVCGRVQVHWLWFVLEHLPGHKGPCKADH